MSLVKTKKGASFGAPKRGLMVAGGLLTLSVGFAVTVVAPGCITQADEEPLAFACPPGAQWPMVSQVLERKCGTLDCHGDRSRPFRLYGRNGARLSESMVVGDTDATSPPELAANRASACGLEPEHMAAVIAGEEQATESLTLLRKPLLIEAHKGGRVWTEESPGYLCLSSWIDGATDGAACDEELRIP